MNEEKNVDSSVFFTQPQVNKKPLVVAVSYKNEGEDFERILMLSVEPIRIKLEKGEITKEVYEQLSNTVLQTMLGILDGYSIVPRTPQFDNVKPADFEERNNLTRA